MYLVYKKATGEFINGGLMCSKEMLPLNRTLLNNDEDCLDYEVDQTQISWDTHYFDLISTVRVRPEITATANKPEIQANGIDLFILTGLPVDCKIIISDTDIVTEDIIAIVREDQEISFPTNIPGSYKIKAELFPYITKEWEITAI